MCIYRESLQNVLDHCVCSPSFSSPSRMSFKPKYHAECETECISFWFGNMQKSLGFQSCCGTILDHTCFGIIS